MRRDLGGSGAPLVTGFVAAGLVVVTLLVYCRCLDHPFIGFDDEYYVTENLHVQQGLTAEDVRWAFTTFACANWHPLTWLSLQLDATVYAPQNAGGFHLTNVLLHAVSTVLLFLILRGMTGLVWRSAMVAALFALHPLNVEPVAWVAERKGVLSTLFWMLTLAAYRGYVQRASIGRYFLVGLSLVLGLMAKPVLVTLPLVLVLLDYWPLGRLRHRSLRQLLLEKTPLFLLCLAWCVIAFMAQQRGGALPSLEAIPLPVRIGNGLLAYAGYLGQLFWPFHLAVFYPHPGSSLSGLQASAAGALLLCITTLVLGPGRRWPYLAVGWLWYLGTLVPVIGLVQVSTHAGADRYTYVPLVGLFLLLTWGASDLASAWRLPRVLLAATSTAALIGCAVLTWVQLGYWRNDLTLWEHAIAVTGESALAHLNLGVYYCGQGDLIAARKEFEAATAVDPTLAQAHFNLGKVLQDLGQPAEALQEYRKSGALNPTAPPVHYNMGLVLRELGQNEKAIQEYEEAVRLRPDWAEAQINLGLALLDSGRFAEALDRLKCGHELGSRDPHWPYPSAQWVRQAEQSLLRTTEARRPRED